jgi:hypothetical protein
LLGCTNGRVGTSAGQERLEAAVNTMQSKFEEIINKRVDILASVDQWTKSLPKELSTDIWQAPPLPKTFTKKCNMEIQGM